MNGTSECSERMSDVEVSLEDWSGSRETDGGTGSVVERREKGREKRASVEGKGKAAEIGLRVRVNVIQGERGRSLPWEIRGRRTSREYYL